MAEEKDLERPGDEAEAEAGKQEGTCRTCAEADKDIRDQAGTKQDCRKEAEGHGQDEGTTSDEHEEACREGSEKADDEHAESAFEAETGSGDEAGSEEKAEDEKPAADKRDKQIEELTDKYKRLFAEFDNYRKRTELEKASMYDEGEKYVLLKILPVVDNFERALASVPEELKDSSYVEGMDKIYRSFMDLLKELRVTPIEAAGQPFDANLHNAVMHVDDDSLGENIIAEEFQKGYMFKDRVLRHSMVKVAN